MKTKIIIAILAVLFFSCEKEELKTTYSFKNELPVPIYNFMTYYYDGNNRHEVQNHGALLSNDITKTIETGYEEISFTLALDPNGVSFVNLDIFNVKQNKDNYFVIDENTVLYGGTTYTFINSSSYKLSSVATAFFNSNTGEFDEYFDHGPVEIGQRTEIIKTDKKSIDIIFSFQGNKNVYYYRESLLYDDMTFIVFTDYTLYEYLYTDE